MKNPTASHWLIILLLFQSIQGFSQISVPSTNGYSVNITVTPTTILPTSMTCIWGYNYNVRLNYAITFSGSNIPSSLYTLQGTIGCSGPVTHFFQLPTNGGSGTTTTTSNQWTSLTNCQTATITSMGCNTANITIAGPGINSHTVTFIVAQPLPVTLVSFGAQRQGPAVQLSWTTVTEINNDHFSIERSADATNWDVIGTVRGAGNSVVRLNYLFTDTDPLPIQAYYRLKQTDINGQFQYSSIVSADAAKSNAIVTLYPVPNDGNTIHFTGITDFLNTGLVVHTITGAVVVQQKVTSPTLTLPVLGKGFYIIEIKNPVTGMEQSFRYVQL